MMLGIPHEQEDEAAPCTEADGHRLHLSRRSASGYLGVFPLTSGRGFEARHKGNYLGAFPTKLEAAIAYAKSVEAGGRVGGEEEDEVTMHTEAGGHRRQAAGATEGMAGAGATRGRRIEMKIEHVRTCEWNPPAPSIGRISVPRAPCSACSYMPPTWERSSEPAAHCVAWAGGRG